MSSSTAAFSCTRIIPEAMYTLAARIEDADHGADWLDSCRESHLVHPPGTPSPRPNRPQFEAYERLKGLPDWNISDRDVYLTGTWRQDANGLQCVLRPSDHPADWGRPGVVRMPSLTGSFSLRPLNQNATEVTYALSVNLGGNIPGFVTKRAVKEIPAKSLKGLEREAQKGPGDYAQAGQELAAALQP